MIGRYKCICHKEYISHLNEILCNKNDIVEYKCYEILGRLRYSIKFKGHSTTEVSMPYSDFIKNFTEICEHREKQLIEILK